MWTTRGRDQFHHLKRIKKVVNTDGQSILHVLLCPENERERLEAIIKTDLAPFALNFDVVQVEFCCLLVPVFNCLTYPPIKMWTHVYLRRCHFNAHSVNNNNKIGPEHSSTLAYTLQRNASLLATKVLPAAKDPGFATGMRSRPCQIYANSRQSRGQSIGCRLRRHRSSPCRSGGRPSSCSGKSDGQTSTEAPGHAMHWEIFQCS